MEMLREIDALSRAMTVSAVYFLCEVVDFKISAGCKLCDLSKLDGQAEFGLAFYGDVM
jgi:hypothetical protein